MQYVDRVLVMYVEHARAIFELAFNHPQASNWDYVFTEFATVRSTPN